jgi:hypothetical protein
MIERKHSMTVFETTDDAEGRTVLEEMSRILIAPA